MINKKYLTNHPNVVKKLNLTPNSIKSNQTSFDADQYIQQLIETQNSLTQELSLKIKEMERRNYLARESIKYYDPTKQIIDLENRIKQLKDEESNVNKQIENCQKVQNITSPQEYFLWSKKQRVDTFDTSMGQLYLEIERKRQNFIKGIQNNHKEIQNIRNEMQEIEQKIYNYNNRPPSLSIDLEENEEDLPQVLLEKNLSMKEQYSNMISTVQIFQQNKEILSAQLIDNADSIEKTLRSYFETEKIKLTRQLKQIQNDFKGSEVSALSPEQVNYKIDPLLADYAYKLKQLSNSVQNQLKPLISRILMPLPWQNFNYLELIDKNKKNDDVYNEYRGLEQECMKNQEQIKELQQKIKQINSDMTVFAQKTQQISVGIFKMNKILDK